jgi:HAE1 family hydrophobic/amphiphilic exporter-1
MLPLALAIGEGAEQRAPMAHAVIGGLITSTLLTLFVVPVFYTLLDYLAVRVLGKKPVKAAEPTHAYGD